VGVLPERARVLAVLRADPRAGRSDARGLADHAPRADEPRRRDRLRGRRPAQLRDRGAGDERHRDQDGAALPLAGGDEGGRGVNGRYVFTGARVIDPAAGSDEVRDVVVAEGVIGGAEGAGGAERIEATGLVIAPGL